MYLPYARALTARIWHTLKAIMPRWLMIAFTVCLVIPGPFDELALLLVATPLLIIRRNRAITAWKEYVK